MPTWTDSDFDNAQSESGVVHQNTANTDHNDASEITKGYDYQNFSEITPTPVSCWPLHEDSGTTTNDLAGSNNGTNNGATVGQTGILGTTAYDFDGTDDEVDIPDITSLSKFTLTFWIYPRDDSSDQRPFANRANNDFSAQILSSGEMNFRIYNGSFNVGTTGDSVVLNDWSFYAMVWDGSSAELFNNATSEASGSVSNNPGAGGDVHISRPSFALDGKLADVRLYDCALSQSQIQTLYDVVATAGSHTSNKKSL
jgi:hypothetical protein